MGECTDLEKRVKYNFEQFYSPIAERVDRVDIELQIMPSVINTPVNIEEKIGPISQKILDIYEAESRHRVPEEKAGQYNSAMMKNWDLMSQVVASPDKYDIFSDDMAESFGIERDDLSEFYNLATLVFKNLEHKNKNFTKKTVRYGEETTKMEGVSLWLYYKISCDRDTDHVFEHNEQIKYLGGDDFNSELGKNEINYILFELKRRRETIGDKPVGLKVGQIGNKGEVLSVPELNDVEEVREEITDYLRNI